MPFDKENTAFSVLSNHEGQYSIWPLERETPAGWRPAGYFGPKADCLAFIDQIWTDMRPLSLRAGRGAEVMHP